MMRTTVNRRLLMCLVLLALLLPGHNHQGLQASSNVVNAVGYFGAVGIVKDENGNPMLAEYGADGGIIKELGYLGVGDYVNATLMTADQYKTLQKLLAKYKEDHDASRDGLAVGATLMTRNQYLSRAFTTNTRPPQPIISPTLVYKNTHSVLVIAENKLLSPSPAYNSMVLMEFPADLTQNIDLENTNTRALILNEAGQVIYKSDNDISYKAEVYKDRDATEGNKRLWAPRGVPMEASIFGGGGSDVNGEFHVTVVMPPCPGFAYDFKIPITARIPMQNFNPKNGMVVTDFAGYNHYGGCVGYGEVPLGASLMDQLSRISQIGVTTTLAVPAYKTTFWASTMQLSAVGTMPQVSLAATTEYSHEDFPIGLQTGYNFDFDGDNRLDRWATSPTAPGMIDVFLGNSTQASLSRLGDHQLNPQLVHQGLLASISKVDLENTDIYIYRVSNGQRVAEIEGLEQKDAVSEGSGGVSTGYKGGSTYRGVHDDQLDTATFGFSSLILGANDFQINRYLANRLGNSDINRSPWTPSQSGNGGFNGQKPDFLRPGELLKLIAINRATGYIGTSTMRINGTQVVPSTPIAMYPPNLKIIASRDFDDKQGLTKNTDNAHHYNLIGNEGAGLASDNFIVIKTTWLDHDGTPLPEDLPGYTGRVAISTGSQTVDFSNTFPIKPGYNMQFVQLNNAADLTTEHFYVQAVGEDFFGTPSFAGTGAGTGKLATRPKYYVPLLVPILDEITTRTQQNILAQARRDGVPNLPEAVIPTYYWVYRPEMQFSVFDLRVDSLQFEDNNNNLHTVDLNQSDNQFGDVLNYENDYVDVLYSLINPSADPLPFMGPDRQLVFALGEAEVIITQFNAYQPIRFEDIRQLSLLDANDYLTLRVFVNNDPTNVLWEFAFQRTLLMVDGNRDGKISSLKTQLAPNQKPDRIYKDQPFVFWVNDDLDAYTSNGSNTPEYNTKFCDRAASQDCVEWDFTENGSTNTSNDRINEIESVRDLEDFSPLEIRITPYSPGQIVKLRAVGGFSINVFKGLWKTGIDFISDNTLAQRQVNSNLAEHVGLIDGNELILNTRYLEKNEQGSEDERVAKLIFEGVTPSPANCDNDNEACYLEVAVYETVDGKEKLVSKDMLYMRIYPIDKLYEHYTVAGADGSGVGVQPETQAHLIAGGSVTIPSGFIENPDQYMLFVHGWRMKPEERIRFAETALKRLYWSGYKGRFGFFSWPTDYCTMLAGCIATFDLDNYDNSEVIARRSALGLYGLMVEKRAQYSSSFNVMVHSMGNIVTSEALRLSPTGQRVVDTYIASQSAETASAYDQNAIRPDLLSKNTITQNQNTTYNIPPPDKYTYNTHVTGRPADPANIAQHNVYIGKADPVNSKHYYNGLRTSARSIINFGNGLDVAFGNNIWVLNQNTKPGFVTISYSGVFTDEPIKQPDGVSYEGTIIDRFCRGFVCADLNYSILWDRADIFGHVIGARAHSLGRNLKTSSEIGVVSNPVDLGSSPFGLDDRDGDHSGEFNFTYGEMKFYWKTLMEKTGVL